MIDNDQWHRWIYSIEQYWGKILVPFYLAEERKVWIMVESEWDDCFDKNIIQHIDLFTAEIIIIFG